MIAALTIIEMRMPTSGSPNTSARGSSATNSSMNTIPLSAPTSAPIATPSSGWWPLWRNTTGVVVLPTSTQKMKK